MANLASLIINIKALGAAQAANDLNKVAAASGGTEEKTKSLTRSTDSLSNAYSALRRSAAAYATYSIVKSITQTGLEFDRMERSLFAATGSMEGAKTEMKFLREESNRIGVDLLATGKAFSQLTAASVGTAISQAQVRDIFTSVSEAAVVLGLSADDTKGAFRALVQVMSKGKVQAEELRGQLGERFPGAFQAAARAMNLTSAEMSKMLEDGNVISDEFLPKFAAEIRRTYAAAVPEAMDSAQAAFARFHNAMNEAQNELAQGGLLDALSIAATKTAEVTNHLIDEVKTTAEWAAALSVGQISFWEWMTTGADEASEKLTAMKAQMNDMNGVRVKMPKRPSEQIAQKSSGQLREEARAKARAEKEFDNLIKDLRSQEEVVEFSYKERMRILDEHVDKGTAKYREMSDRISAMRQEEMEDLKGKGNIELESLIDSLRTQEEAIKESYRRRVEIIENADIDENARQDLMTRAQADRDKQLEDLKASKEQEFNVIVESLKSEEEKLLASYNRRREIILNNTEETSTARAELIRKLDEEFASEALGGFSEPDSYEEELAAVEDLYQRRHELIMANTALTAETKNALEIELERQKNEVLENMERARMEAIFKGTSETFAGLAELTKIFMGEQSKEYKAMFAVSQAFEIAQAIMKTYSAATGAYSAMASIPYVGPALGAAAAAAAIGAGMANVAQIRSQSYSGAYDSGGKIPSGSVGLVGEIGPELVSGPANVTSRKETAELLKKETAPTPPPVNNIRIVNAFDTAVVGEYMGSDAGEKAILNVVKRNKTTMKQIMG